MGQFSLPPRGIHGLTPIYNFLLKLFQYLDPVEQNGTKQETSGFLGYIGKYLFYRVILENIYFTEHHFLV